MLSLEFFLTFLFFLSILDFTIGIVTFTTIYPHCPSYPKSCSQNSIPSGGCDPLNLRLLNITSPIELETVVSSNGVSKTVEAEKEAFLCTYKQNKPTQILDVILFTEIFEKFQVEQ